MNVIIMVIQIKFLSMRIYEHKLIMKSVANSVRPDLQKL